MKNKIALLCLLGCSTVQASQEIVRINDTARFASHKLGKIELYHANGEFKVMHDNKLHAVENHCVDKPLRNVDLKKLAMFLNHGHLAVNKTDNGEFTIRANAHGKGGGPVCAWWAYGTAKAFCWTTVGITAGASVAGAVVATGGGAVVAAGTGTMVGKVVTGIGTAGMALSTTVPAAGAAAATVAAAGTANTALAITAASSGIGLVAAVETASLGFAALFAGPWCP